MSKAHTHDASFSYGRDPCPYNILNDAGGAFALGAIGGTLWHSVKGFRNSPRGHRISGAIQSVKMRAPVLGGNFGAWGFLFSSFDCAIMGLRKKEDPWNTIGAAFCSGGCLALRNGFRPALNGAIACAVLLAVIEGLSIGINKYFAGSTRLTVPKPPTKE